MTLLLSVRLGVRLNRVPVRCAVYLLPGGERRQVVSQSGFEPQAESIPCMALTTDKLGDGTPLLLVSLGTAANWADLLLPSVAPPGKAITKKKHGHPNDVTHTQVGNRTSVSVCVLNSLIS